jgi:hypothetical protein
MNASIQASAIESALPISRDLQVGDVVRIKGTKDIGRIIKESCVDYTVCVLGGMNHDERFAVNQLEMWTPAPRRQFKRGEVRIVGTRFSGRIGHLGGDNGNEEEDRPYLVMLYDVETDEQFSASELIPWVPMAGDWVTEWQSDGHEVGIILANDGNTSHVQWEKRKDAPYWPNIRLEPTAIPAWGLANSTARAD